MADDALKNGSTGCIDADTCLSTDDAASVNDIASATSILQSSNSVELELQTNALSVRLKSEAADQKTIQLAAQLELLYRLYEQTNSRLEASLKRIGYLEARLADYESQTVAVI